MSGRWGCDKDCWFSALELFSVLCSTFPVFDGKRESYEIVPCRSVAAFLADAGYRTRLFPSGRFAYLRHCRFAVLPFFA